MSSHRILLSGALALVAGLGTTATTSGAASPCREGFAKGDWDLPAGPVDGFIDGILIQTSPSPGPVVAYTISGLLIDVPTPCLSCIEGKVDAVLDDGFGPAPDYVVRGTYSGFWFTGEGTWSAKIYDPTGTTAVGKIVGTFKDPPSSPTFGSFKADWSICP